MEKKLIKNKKIKKIWTNKEDNILKYLINKNGPKKWTSMAKNLPGREGKQCRERWYNHLDPNINKSLWSEEEEWLLFLLHNIYGNKWACISIYIENRTDNTIKNHWNSIMKKKIPKWNEKLKFYIENKENLEKENEIYELINKIQKGETYKTISKKGRKTKEEFDKFKLLSSNQSYLKSIKNFNENKWSSNAKIINFQSTKSKEIDFNYNKNNFLNSENFLDFNQLTPNSKQKGIYDKIINFSNEKSSSKYKFNFLNSNINSDIKIFNSFKSKINDEDDLKKDIKYSDICFRLFNIFNYNKNNFIFNFQFIIFFMLIKYLKDFIIKLYFF